MPSGSRLGQLTVGEVERWQREALARRAEHVPGRVLAGMPPVLGDCMECGKPAYDMNVEYAGGSLPWDPDARMKSVVFRPCGCRVGVYDPPVLDRIPEGTRPDRYAVVPIDAPVDERTLTEVVMPVMRRELAAQLGCKPHVVELLDGGDVRRRLGEFGIGVSAVLEGKAAVGFVLRAIPGATPFVVYRVADAGLPDGARALDGKWERRDALRAGSPRFAFSTGPVGWDVVKGVAQPTGRVELNESGQAAEVYEITL